MDAHRIGIVWPEAVQARHLAELELFVPPEPRARYRTGGIRARAWPRGHHAGPRGAPRPRSRTSATRPDGSPSAAPKPWPTAAPPAATSSAPTATRPSWRTCAPPPAYQPPQPPPPRSPPCASWACGDWRCSPHTSTRSTSACAPTSKPAASPWSTWLGLNQRGDIEAIEPDATRDLVTSRVDMHPQRRGHLHQLHRPTHAATIIDELEKSLVQARRHRQPSHPLAPRQPRRQPQPPRPPEDACSRPHPANRGGPCRHSLRRCLVNPVPGDEPSRCSILGLAAAVDDRDATGQRSIHEVTLNSHRALKKARG